MATASRPDLSARSRATPTAGNLRSHDVDARHLASALREVVKGEVRFDDGSRALYATDGSNYRQVPIGVVLPRDKEDVVATVGLCRRYGAPVLSRGGGTSLAGQCCNVAVVMDMSKYLSGVLEIDADRRLARVLPGTVLDDLRKATAPYGLTFGPDPATHTHCTLGGMIGNDSCGIHSVMAARDGDGARVADNIAELEILTWDGARFRVGRTSDDELRPHRGRREDVVVPSTRAFATSGTATPIASGLGFPTFRVESRATISRSCCRSMDSTWPGPWLVRRAPASRCWRRRST